MTELTHDGYARGLVPEQATGSAWRVFFIVTGSLCGLPAFILAARISSGLEPTQAVAAMLVGGLISGGLGGLSAYTGARTRMTLALLAELAFGRWGAQAVKAMVAIALIGWFGVIVSVLGQTASTAAATEFGLHLQPYVVSLPMTVLIALVTLRGVKGLDALGRVILPLVTILIGLSIILALHRPAAAAATPGGLGFSGAVSAITGSFIVGIVVQPDYGRFVRRPLRAGAATAVALAVVYPAILFLSALPAIRLGQPDLIAALAVLRLGGPGLLLLVMGAWIDASGSLYSGSLAFTNMIPRLKLPVVIIAGAAIGAASALAHAEAHFLAFLQMLGLILPPVAAVQITQALLSRTRRGARTIGPETPRWRLEPTTAALAGVAVGAATTGGWLRLTGLATLDSIAVSTALAVLGFAFRSSRSQNILSSSPPGEPATETGER